jgi:hypothetical protein
MNDWEVGTPWHVVDFVIDNYVDQMTKISDAYLMPKKSELERFQLELQTTQKLNIMLVWGVIVLCEGVVSPTCPKLLIETRKFLPVGAKLDIIVSAPGIGCYIKGWATARIKML